MDAEFLALAAAAGAAVGRVVNKYRESAWKRDAAASRADLDEYQSQAQARIDRLQERVAELEKQRDAADARAAQRADELSAWRAQCEDCQHRDTCIRSRQ